METMMFSPKATFLAVVILGIVFTSGALALLGHPNERSYDKTPPQIDSIDMMSNAWDSSSQKK
jgi:hypothetical protein